MAKEVKKTYFKLGKTAASFYDPVVKLKIAGKGVGVLTLAKTRRIENALRHGHIVTATEKEYQEWLGAQDNSEAIEKSNQSSVKELDEMTVPELVAYYKENYDVSDEDLKAFNKLDKAEKLAFLKDDGSDEE